MPFHPEIPPVISPTVNFRTLSEAPVAKTGNAWWSSPADTSPSLLLTGFVNPKSEPTNFYFQYVTQEQFAESGYAEASSVPTPPGEPAAASFNTVEVQQPVYELDPNYTYHYRIAAVNATGTTFGEDRTLAPPDPSERFYELVSNGNSAGLGLKFAGQVLSVADAGSRAIFNAQVINDPAAGTGLQTGQLAERTATGWRVTSLTPDPSHTRGSLVGEYQTASDLSRFLFEGTSEEQSRSGKRIFRLVFPDGSSEPASALISPLTNENGSSTSAFENGHATYRELGASADLSRYAFTIEGSTKMTLVPGEPLTEQAKPYFLNTKTHILDYVNRDSVGNLIGGNCGARLGGNLSSIEGFAAHAISSDGSVVYFSAKPGAPLGSPCTSAVKSEFGTRIFKRVNDETTTEVSASQCNRPALPEPPGPCKNIAGDDTYRGASDDGSVVFFSSPRQLTNSDVDSANDLYVYDSNPPAGEPTLVQATAGAVTAGHPTIGSGSGFLGVVDTSSDGSHVYFTATGQLTPAATNGAANLYVYERDAAHPAGRIHFIATLSLSSDSFDWTGFGEVHALPGMVDQEGSYSFGDGHFLLFVTATSLVGEDTDTAKDLYRYNDETEQLICLSCAGNGTKPVFIMRLGGAENGKSLGDFAQMGRVASADVSDVVFATEEGLVPADQNSKMDVYEWREGQLIWVSRDTGELGISFINLGIAILGNPVISQDGKDVYFATEARLVPSDQDTDNALDVYDARIGGGFPSPKPEARICPNGEICRGSTTEPPLTAKNESATSQGPGNPAVPPVKKRICPKGKVKRHGRCVKHKHRRHLHANRPWQQQRGDK